MPRGPRFAFQDTFYHVFNRGINKQTLFFSRDDYSFFLKKLHTLKEKFDHSLYAYCLMPNHFHLSIHTRRAPISKIMASLSTSYSMYFNKKFHHFGAVFQNRFKSIVIQNDAYFLQLSKYIYLNPVKAGFVKDMANYPFSSILEVLGKAPLFYLDSDITRLIGDTAGSLEQYKQFLYAKENYDEEEFDMLFQQEEGVLGNKEFSTHVIKKYLRKKNKRLTLAD